MLTTRQPVFRKFWHAVMPLSRLEGGQPVPFTLMGEPIVLFLDAQGQPAALRDRCEPLGAAVRVQGEPSVVAFVEPQPREMSQSLPSNRLNR
jgi:hypothetical protein